MHLLYSFQKKAAYPSVPRLVLAVAVPTVRRKDQQRPLPPKLNEVHWGTLLVLKLHGCTQPFRFLCPSLSNVSKVITLRFSMGDIIRNISRVDQAVCWPDPLRPSMKSNGMHAMQLSSVYTR